LKPTKRTITGHHEGDCSARRNPVKAFRFAPTPFGAYGLDRLAVEPTEGIYVMAGMHEPTSRKDRTMREFSPTHNITVEIADQLRVYSAHITTADPAFDGPSTVTLYRSTLTDLSGYAADPIVHDVAFGKTPARLVLIESREFRWHRAKYREEGCIFAAADPTLFNLNTLQGWLWQRLQAPAATEVHA
jgi:hypothetical protein